MFPPQRTVRLPHSRYRYRKRRGIRQRRAPQNQSKGNLLYYSAGQTDRCAVTSCKFCCRLVRISTVAYA
jgi:hypothetical protein